MNLHGPCVTKERGRGELGYAGYCWAMQAYWCRGPAAVLLAARLGQRELGWSAGALVGRASWTAGLEGGVAEPGKRGVEQACLAGLEGEKRGGF